MIQDRFQQRIIEQVVNVQTQPKSSRKRCRERERERIHWSECEINQMTKHIVHTVKVEQQMIIKIAVQGKESVQGSSDHASLVHRGGGVKETKQLAKHTESPERRHIHKVMCRCVTQAEFNIPSRPEKPCGVIKLQNIDKVVDSSVNMRRSVRQCGRCREPSKEHKYTRTTSSLMCQLRCMSKPREFLPIFVPQGASDIRGIVNCGSSLKE